MTHNSAVTLTYIEFMFDSVKANAGITRVTRLSARGNAAGVLAVSNPPAGNPPAGNPWAGELPAGNPPAGALPVLPALGELLPGGLARGSVVAAGRWSLLCLALAAGASVAGAWCAVAGVPQLGVSAAADVGRDRGRSRAAAGPAGAGGGGRPGCRGAAADALAVAAGPGRLGRPGGTGGHGNARHRVTTAGPVRVLVVWCPEWPVPPDPDSGRAFERVVSLVAELCPRVEVLRPGACAIGARGPARYFGGEEALAGKIIEAVTGGGFACRAGIADGLFAARLAARAAAPGTVTIVPPGQAREFLAPYPVSVLGSAEMAELLRLDGAEMAELLPRLGIVTLGEFARLPVSQAVNRFGTPGGIAHRLARGLEPRPLDPRPPPADLPVSAGLDPPAELAEPVVVAAKAR